MKNFLSFFEIPATDFHRAKTFYQSILDIRIEEMDMGGALMGFLPSDGENISGAIVKGDGYSPSAEGVIVYLNGDSDLQMILDKVEPNGGRVILPKTNIGADMGFYAIFSDTEGNRMALHSTN
jgi:predicted enzyme related to lactoylglutathione lyase